MVARKGLVAPQNFFLEAVIRRCNNTDSSFILANAQVCDYPIVYCNEGFSKMVGYSRAEIMQKNASLSSMYGDHTDLGAIQKIQNALENAMTEQLEIGLLKKNKTNLWLLMNISPILDGGGDKAETEALVQDQQQHKGPAAAVNLLAKNNQPKVVLYLCQFKDITPLKEPLEGENNKVLGLSRILQIARVAKYRQQFTPNHIQTKDFMRQLGPAPGNISSNFNQQLMNLGGDVLPQYRQETPKTSPHIILHYSTPKTVWDWSILALTFYTAFMVPFNIAFRPRDPLPLGIDYVILLDSVVDVIFFADILLNFHTTFVGPVGEVVIDPQAIRKNYFKSWFLIDLLSCLPYDIFYMFKQDDERIASLFSALKVVRLLRLGRVARKLDNYLEYGAATLLLLLCAYVLVAHWMACVWYVIGEYEARQKFHYYGEQILPDGWLIRLSYDLKMPFNGTASNLQRLVGGPGRTHCYVSSLYFTMSCMSTVGFGNIASTTMNEKIFGICMMIISALLYAAIFGHMTTIIQQMTSSTQRYHQMISDVREFIRLQEIPNHLAEKVIDYIVSTWAMNKGIDTNKVLGFCPKDMRADICVHMNRKVFKEHFCFTLASDGCKRAFANSMETIHAAPGDLLYHSGESVDALWFLVQGSLEVIQDEEVVAILGKGDVFGDEFWKHSRVGQSACIVRALTYSDLHFIKREPLMQVLSFYKPFANSFARNLVLTYNLTNRLKFRKVDDVRRERELDEKRKNEKLEIPQDHPIRKLLQRMQERHAGRLTSARAENEILVVQNEVNAMMEDPQRAGNNLSGVLDKLSNLERMLETLMSRQLEECRYSPLPPAQPHLPPTEPPPPAPSSFSSAGLYKSTLRNASSKFGQQQRVPSLSLEKGERDQGPPEKPAPRIPPLRLTDDRTTSFYGGSPFMTGANQVPQPPYHSSFSSSHMPMQNHQQQRQQQFRKQSTRLPSIERCPCCHSPHQVPQIHINEEDERDGEEATNSGEETAQSTGKAPPPLMRRF